MHHWLFVRGILRRQGDSPHKGPVMPRVLPFHEIMPLCMDNIKYNNVLQILLLTFSYSNLCTQTVLKKQIYVFANNTIHQHWTDAISSNPSPQDKDLPVLHSEYHACWCPGDASHQGRFSQAIQPSGSGVGSLNSWLLIGWEEWSSRSWGLNCLWHLSQGISTQ